MLTHYHQRHISNLNKYCSSNIIRSIILPKPTTEKEEEIFLELTEIAETHGCQTQIFDRDTETIDFFGTEIHSRVFGYISRSTHPVIGLAFETNDIKTVYVGSSVFEGYAELIAAELNDADNIIFGAHGPILKKSVDLAETDAEIIFAKEDIESFYNIVGGDITGSKNYGDFSMTVKISE